MGCKPWPCRFLGNPEAPRLDLMIPETTIHFSELAKQPGINQWTAITVNETHLGLLLLGEDIEGKPDKASRGIH